MNVKPAPTLPDRSVAALLANLPLRAGAFIVTLFGDVVVPRGGEVWIGNIIDTCASVGISETLVRTAVSRLVASGRLEARRAGRRSFYRLSDAARPEFLSADRAIYGPDGSTGWRFVYLPEALGDGAMAALERAGFARLKPQLAFGPDRIAAPERALSFTACPEGALSALPELAAAAWDLESHAQAYAEFIGRVTPLVGHCPPTAAQALSQRLLLVHLYRQVLLRDPRLPAAALPPDWPGHRARRLFAQLYRQLSDAADSHVGRTFEGATGPLGAQSPATDQRQGSLATLLEV